MNLIRSLKRDIKATVFAPYQFYKIHSATRDFSVAFSNSLGRPEKSFTDEVHLVEAMKWLCRAQDSCQGKGVSIKYDIFSGWDPDPYPETTGYILETFLDYYHYSGDDSFRSRAVRAGDWEIDIQHRSGGVLSSVRNPEKLRVFNTGQVVHGWCRLFSETGERRFIEAATRACDYLIRQQELDGSWIKDTYDHGPRTYQTRTAWAMMRVHHLTGNQAYAEAAFKNLDWALAQQQNNGWFKNCGLADANPITHVIGYTFRGLLEVALMMEAGTAPLKDDRYLNSVVKGCDGFCDAVEKHPALGLRGLAHCSYDSDWKSMENHSCLTGNVQMAGILYKLAKRTGNNRYSRIADDLVEITKKTQNPASMNEGIRGGLAGSYPVHRGYASNLYLNWATKFMADVLLMRILSRKDCVEKAH